MSDRKETAKELRRLKTFQSITVAVRPSTFGDGNVELTTEIISDGEIFGYRELIQQDHFNSLFDHVWYHMKRNLDEVLKTKLGEKRVRPKRNRKK